MTTVAGSKGSVYRLGPRILGGGEGQIHPVAGRQDLLAKIFDKDNPGYEEKLEWMIAHPPRDPGASSGHRSIAWPQEILWDEHGKLAGYLMPRIVDAKEIIEAYNPSARKSAFPEFSRLAQHRAALNFVHVVQAVHDAGYVIGDINPKNALISRYALISLVDTDSYQVTVTRGGRSRVYRCMVGVPEFTPPELQGRKFNDVLRRPEHDAFGLAVMIFRFLLNGSHPFQAIQEQGSAHITEGTRIKRGWYPHQPKPPGGVRPPPGGPTIDTLHPDLERLFRRCFVDGHADPGKRPAVSEWARALATAEQSLTRCRKGHEYSNHLTSCPDCQPSAKQLAPAAPPANVARQAAAAMAQPVANPPVNHAPPAAAAANAPVIQQAVSQSFLARLWHFAARPRMIIFSTILLFGLFAVEQPRQHVDKLRSGQYVNELTNYFSQLGKPSVFTLAYSEDGQYLAVATSDNWGAVTVYSTDEWRSVRRLPSRNRNRRALATAFDYGPNDSYVAGYSNGTINVREEGALRAEQLDSIGTGAVVSVDFILHGVNVISAHTDGTLARWNVSYPGWNEQLQEAMPIKSLNVGRGQILDTDISDDGSLLVFGTSEGSVGVWSTSADQPVFVGTHEYPVDAVAISPDGEFIASAGRSGVLAIWRPFAGEDERLRSTLQVGSAIREVAFSYDGQYIYSATKDEWIEWHVDQERQSAFEKLDEELMSLAVSPQGDSLVFGTRAGSLRERHLIYYTDN